ncbi:hypothetical protein RND81_02G020800 [Saponaria officinalis]|uniref:UBX domain-containing protein n=1 Tax=Saponaria officinalis TaxID=3572 RepID=A0AAW1MR17_SAPOF
MSSIIRDTPRTRGDYPNLSRIVRRIVTLPRTILGGFTRTLENGIDFMGRTDRRNPTFPSTPPPMLPPAHFPMYRPQGEQDNSMFIDEWAFLNSFEQKYGVMHPFFYACRFAQALQIARDEKKLLFLYLHCPDHPFTAEFCRESLCSEIVVQFVDANFVSWGGVFDRGEGLQMCRSLMPGSFPFCAVIAPASADSISVLQQIEGPVSPAELVEILQRTLEEQGVAFGSSRANEDEKTRLDRRLREEQDAAYLASLKVDQEKEKLKNSAREQTAQKPVASSSTSNSRVSQSLKSNPILNKPSQVKESSATKRENQSRDSSSKAIDNQITRILIRFPNGERREHSLLATDKVKAIYKYIDSLKMPGIGNYRLISSFPRKVYDTHHMNITLKDAGLHPKATLFLDLL